MLTQVVHKRKFVHQTLGRLVLSLAGTDPLLPLRDGEGLAKRALDCVIADQSDFTEEIRSKFIHSFRGRVCR